ncbi:MAG: zinc ribbon domain-containing protein [Methanobrevibacter sp.]|uniref:zinc ribbon domain-containing protein n=1 Tax=Methanobrevibacter sp. TaxID=66852 RepID=UPI002E76C148|nr:zinc ribbon domain-containing protein [Methanobrevibacter sp.]MEE0935163.1 zinc ribbon domain-containing protein [Methanobrevibacter sp.]
MKLDNLSKYTEIDREKLELIRSAMPEMEVREKVYYSKDLIEDQMDFSPELSLNAPPIDYKITKVCPKCGRKYPDSEIFCFDCAVALKDIEKVNVRQIDINHEFTVEGENSYTDFNEILTAENLLELTKFEFERDDFNEIIRNIKLKALKNLDSAIKANEIDLDTLSILEKVILFTKSFVNVEYKSYGQELGFYRFNSIFVDDRQLDALQITTMLHELTHFLIKEILTHILCRLLDASKTKEMESIVTFILSYSAENCLIDEYAAHTVEGRFTLIGYQDYSSFLNIQKTIERSKDEIDMLKTIGNSLANTVKEIVESFIDIDLLEDIKKQFRRDILDEPDYSQLMLENCTLLNDVGFLRAIEFIIVDGFAVSMDNIEKLNQINEMW